MGPVGATSSDPDRLRPLLWPRPDGWPTSWVAVSDLPRPAARRLRLFGVACARELSHLLTDEDRAAVRVSERYADGHETKEGLVAVSRPLSVGPPVLSRHVSDCVGWAVLGYHGQHPAADPDNFHVWEPFSAAWDAARALAKEAGRREAFIAARARQAALLLDLAGPPGGSSAFSPAWRTESVVALARGMYESRDFAAMPVLADALEEAGCADPDVLAHCRGAGPHVRGCWVVDLVFGKG